MSALLLKYKAREWDESVYEFGNDDETIEHHSGRLPQIWAHLVKSSSTYIIEQHFLFFSWSS